MITKIRMILEIGKDREEIKAGVMVMNKMVIMIATQEVIIQEGDLEV